MPAVMEKKICIRSSFPAGQHMTERNPDHRGLKNGQNLQPSTLPNASETSSVARSLRCFRRLAFAWLRSPDRFLSDAVPEQFPRRAADTVALAPVAEQFRSG
jgi:hypothetical protein